MYHVLLCDGMCLQEYGYYADDDLFGYGDYYDEYYDYYDDVDTVKDCEVDKDGKVKLANGTAPCDIKIEGVDDQADLLKGGIDGVYKLYSCHDGRPAYKRKDSPAGEQRAAAANDSGCCLQELLCVCLYTAVESSAKTQTHQQAPEVF